MAAVDVDDVHGLGVFNDEVNTVSDCDNSSEKPLYLFGDAVSLENRLFAFVELYDVGLLGGYCGDVALDFVVERKAIDGDSVKRLVKDIPEHHRCAVELAHELARSLAPV